MTFSVPYHIVWQTYFKAFYALTFPTTSNASLTSSSAIETSVSPSATMDSLSRNKSQLWLNCPIRWDRYLWWNAGFRHARFFFQDWWSTLNYKTGLLTCHFHFYSCMTDLWQMVRRNFHIAPGMVEEKGLGSVCVCVGEGYSGFSIKVP